MNRNTKIGLNLGYAIALWNEAGKFNTTKYYFVRAAALECLLNFSIAVILSMVEGLRLNKNA